MPISWLVDTDKNVTIVDKSVEWLRQQKIQLPMPTAVDSVTSFATGGAGGVAGRTPSGKQAARQPADVAVSALLHLADEQLRSWREYTDRSIDNLRVVEAQTPVYAGSRLQQLAGEAVHSALTKHAYLAPFFVPVAPLVPRWQLVMVAGTTMVGLMTITVW